jgi:hypothetical protein
LLLWTLVALLPAGGQLGCSDDEPLNLPADAARLDALDAAPADVAKPLDAQDGPAASDTSPSDVAVVPDVPGADVAEGDAMNDASSADGGDANLDAAADGGGDVAEADDGPALSAAWLAVRAEFGVLETFAGKGGADNKNEWLTSFEGGPAIAAELSRPHVARADGQGNVYICDKEAHAVRKVAPDGIITTVAGTNAAGNGDDAAGPATTRAMMNPNGLDVMADGTLYILDLDNGKIRKVTPAGQMTTLITVAGGIQVGRGLHVASDESEVMFSSGTVLKRWTPGGGVTNHATGFVDLGGIAWDAVKQRWLVTDRGAHRVYAVSAASPVSKDVLAGNGTTGVGIDNRPALDIALYGATTVWPHEKGYFVGLYQGAQIWFIEWSGIAHLFLDGSLTSHAGDGLNWDTPGKKINDIRALSLDKDGNLLFVDADVGYGRRVRHK